MSRETIETIAEARQMPELSFDVSEERSKPRLEALLFFDSSNQTKENKINLIGVFDRVYVKNIPGETPGFGLYIRLARVRVPPRLFVTITDPENERLATIELGVQRSNEEEFERAMKEGLPVRIQLAGRMEIEVKREGVHWFAVHSGDDILGGTGLMIEHRKDAE